MCITKSFFAYILLFLINFFPASIFAVDNLKDCEICEDCKDNNIKEVKLFVCKMVKNVDTILKDTNTIELKRSELEKLLTVSLDFDFMSRQVLGREGINIRSEQPEKFDRFRNLYTEYLIKYYSSLVKRFNLNNQEVQIVSVLDNKNNNFTVNTVVNIDSNRVIKIDYRVRRDNDIIRVVDVISEGISLLMSHRSQFSSNLRDSGIDAVILSLEQNLNNIK